MDNVFIHFYSTTPLITRVLCTGIVIILCLTTFEIVSGIYFMLSRYHIFNLDNFIVFRHFRQLVMRLLVAPLYYGKAGMDTLFHIMFFYRYSCMLEETYIYKSDYFFIIFLCYCSLIIGSMFKLFTSLGPSFACIVTYIWTRKNPRTVIQAYGFVTFHAFYLPFILPIYTLLSDGTVSLEEIMGIVCGHFIFFFKEIYNLF